MKKNYKKLPTAKETLDIINKPWCTSEDISILTGFGETKSAAIKKEINDELRNQGFRVIDNYVPTDRLIVYLNLNIEYLKKVSDIVSEYE